MPVVAEGRKGFQDVVALLPRIVTDTDTRSSAAWQRSLRADLCCLSCCRRAGGLLEEGRCSGEAVNWRCLQSQTLPMPPEVAIELKKRRGGLKRLVEVFFPQSLSPKPWWSLLPLSLVESCKRRFGSTVLTQTDMAYTGKVRGRRKRFWHVDLLRLVVCMRR